jgi:hypothetical protein
VTAPSFSALSRELAAKLEKPVLYLYGTRKERISKPDSLRLEIQALTDFLCSNKIEILNVAGPRESKEPGVYEWTLNNVEISESGSGSTEAAGRVRVGREELGTVGA